MSYAIIGFGKLGQALAKAFARSGIEVAVATTRNPESFASAAAAIGAWIIPKTLAEAVKADVVFLAVRFESHSRVALADGKLDAAAQAQQIVAVARDGQRVKLVGAGDGAARSAPDPARAQAARAGGDAARAAAAAGGA